MTKIRWSEVPTHSGYSVSEHGEIRGPSGRVLCPMANDSGHLYVLTPLPRRPRKLFVHRAVLLAFVGHPLPGHEARHLDDDPTNNVLRNLTWGTRIENAADRRRNGGYHRSRWWSSARLTDAQVQRVLTDGRSARLVADDYGVSHTTILRLRRRGR